MPLRLYRDPLASHRVKSALSDVQRADRHRIALSITARVGPKDADACEAACHNDNDGEVVNAYGQHLHVAR